MRDTIATLFRAGRTRAAPPPPSPLLLGLACGLGGCAGGGAAPAALSPWPAAVGPRSRSNRSMARRRRSSIEWSSVLDSESKLRNLSIVSREGSASYRVRSYLAAQVSRGRTTIAWVWDVYDRDQQRALRLCRRGTGRQGRTRPLGRGRRSGAAENRAGRIERPQRHGQRNGAGGCAAARLGSRASAALRLRARNSLCPLRRAFSVSALSYSAR